MLSFFGWGSKSPSPSPSAPSSSSSPPPSDSRRIQEQQQQQQQPEPTPKTPPTPQIDKNLKLLYGGLTFLALSIFLTRRSYRSRLLSSIPPYYTSSTYHKPSVSGVTDAADALALATINVCSFSMALSGGVLYALNINSLDDLRVIARKSFAGAGSGNGSGHGQSDEELEEEIEVWVASVLGKKGEKEMQRVKEERRNGEEEAEAGTGTESRD